MERLSGTLMCVERGFWHTLLQKQCRERSGDDTLVDTHTFVKNCLADEQLKDNTQIYCNCPAQIFMVAFHSVALLNAEVFTNSLHVCFKGG